MSSSTLNRLLKSEQRSQLAQLKRLRADLAASLPHLSGPEKVETWVRFQAVQAEIRDLLHPSAR